MAVADWRSEFDGPGYAPWGNVGEGGVAWNINFSNSQMHVNRIYEPGGGYTGYHSVAIARNFNPNGSAVTNFRVSARVGWDAAEYNEIYVGFTPDAQRQYPAGFLAYLKQPGRAPRFEFQEAGSETVTAPAPASGYATFTLEVNNGIGSAWVDDTLLFRNTVNLFEPPRSMIIVFGGPDSTQFAPLHVDWAQYNAVPEPATMFVLGGCSAMVIAARRRKLNHPNSARL